MTTTAKRLAAAAALTGAALAMSTQAHAATLPAVGPHLPAGQDAAGQSPLSSLPLVGSLTSGTGNLAGGLPLSGLPVSGGL